MKKKRIISKKKIIKKKQFQMAWQPQPGESLKEYFAFERYLLLGPGRSIVETARTYRLCRNTISKYASRWHWEQRALLYDSTQYRFNSETMLKEAESARNLLRSTRSALAANAGTVLNQLSSVLKDFPASCENPQVTKRVRFLFNVSRTIEKLISLTRVPYEEQSFIIKSIPENIPQPNQTNENSATQEIKQSPVIENKEESKPDENNKVPQEIEQEKFVPASNSYFLQRKSIVSKLDNLRDKLEQKKNDIKLA